MKVLWHSPSCYLVWIQEVYSVSSTKYFLKFISSFVLTTFTIHLVNYKPSIYFIVGNFVLGHKSSDNMVKLSELEISNGSSVLWVGTMARLRWFVTYK